MEFTHDDSMTAMLVVAQAREAWRPPPKLKVSEWADQFRYLSAESSSEPGRWSTNRAPYQREIMDTYTDPEVEDVTWVASSQVGKTEILNNIMGYAVDQRPGPMMTIQPTLEMAKAWSKDRLNPMARDTPQLRSKIKINARDGDNTILHKKGPGFQLTISGANSPASLASRPIRDVFADEVDRYDASAGKEGDPLKLAFKRTNNFWNRKRYRTSTPTVEGDSRIMKEWENSDQREYHVPCPHCGHLHTLQWANVHWDKDKDKDGRTIAHHPHTAYMVCPDCGGVIEDRHKGVMLRDEVAGGTARWIAAKEFTGHAGFRINELYSPWRRFRDVVSDFLDSKDDPETLQVWVNTSLGEAYDGDGADTNADPDSMIERLEEYPAQVPSDGYVLVAGVDVQGDRIEVQVDAFGDDEERWFVDYTILYGNPESPDIWQDLDVLLNGTYEHESGTQIGILAANVDSGHHTQMVYNFCMSRAARRIHAVKGMSGEGRPFVSEAKQKKRGKGTRKTPLFLLGVDDGKTTLMTRLKFPEPGPGFWHFPRGHQYVTVEYFKQLTAERRIKKKRAGRPYYEWKLMRPRNEALDCSLYSLAAYRMLPQAMVQNAKESVLFPDQQKSAKRKVRRIRGNFQV